MEAKAEILIPPLKHAHLGKGVNKTLGVLMPCPFKIIPKISEPIQVKERVEQEELTISDSEDFASKIAAVVGVSFSAFGCQAAGSYIFEKFSFSKKATFQYIITRRITYPVQMMDLNSLVLREDAEEILKTQGLKAFYEIFGEYFIAGEQRGVSGFLCLDVFSDAKSKSNCHSLALAVQRWFVKGELKGEFEQKMAINKLRYELRHSFSGIDKEEEDKYEGSLSSTIQQIRDLSKLAKKDGIVISYVLLPYTHCPALLKYVCNEKLEQGAQISRQLVQEAITQEFIKIQYLLKKNEDNSEVRNQLLEAAHALVENESRITLQTLHEYLKASNIIHKMIDGKKTLVCPSFPLRLFIGNPGVGKSTLLNCLMGEFKFEAGVSIGRGMTMKFIKQQDKRGVWWADTPGLSDVEIRKQAGEEIDKALEQGGEMQVTFVVLIDSGRVREGDKATMGLVLKASKLEKDQYSIIVNKIPRKTLKNVLIDPIESDKLNESLNKGLPGTKYIFYNPLDDDLDEEKDAVKDLSQELKGFIETAPSAKIEQATEIRTDEFDEMKTLFEQQLEAMRTQNKELAEKCNLLLDEKLGQGGGTFKCKTCGKLQRLENASFLLIALRLSKKKLNKSCKIPGCGGDLKYISFWKRELKDNDCL